MNFYLSKEVLEIEQLMNYINDVGCFPENKIERVAEIVDWEIDYFRELNNDDKIKHISESLFNKVELLRAKQDGYLYCKQEFASHESKDDNNVKGVSE